MKKLIPLLITFGLLTSCGSPSIESNSAPIKPTINIDEKRMYSNLETICSSPRPYGSEGETRSSEFIKETLTNLNYKVEIAQFPIYEQSISTLHLKDINPLNSKEIGKGKNIIVKSKHHSENKKTLYVTAHYDTTKNTVGAMDNGSGTAIVLEIATVLKDFNPSYNIVYIFFGAEEYCRAGSKYFVSTLSDTDISNTLGCINIDMIGERDAGPVEIRTINRFDNILSYEFNLSLNTKLQLRRGGSSDELAFFLHKIPTFTLADNYPKIKRSLEPDHIKYIDTAVLKSTGESVCNFLINLNPNKLKPTSSPINGNIKSSNLLTDDNNMGNLKNIPLPKGFKYNRSVVKYVDNGYISKIKYIFKSGSKEIAISISIAPDSESLINNNYKPIPPKDRNIRYYSIEENPGFICRYVISNYYGEITGDITTEEALTILKSISY
ncbi:MAG: M28 family peptidase [Clostridium sp.]|uniref:M28 family peptidase n=1 Tax=Clostridium sp. TaxID=1506 RepID=UPI002FC76212